MISTPTIINPPAGYEIVVSGIVLRDDLVWNEFQRRWIQPRSTEFKLIGPKVSDGWLGVARKIE